VRVVAAQAGPVPSDTLMGLQATHTLAQVADGTGCTVLLVGSRHIELVLGASRHGGLGVMRCAAAASFWRRPVC
jgi:hypothetical protein